MKHMNAKKFGLVALAFSALTVGAFAEGSTYDYAWVTTEFTAWKAAFLPVATGILGLAIGVKGVVAGGKAVVSFVGGIIAKVGK